MEKSLLRPFLVIATLMVLSIVALAYTVDVKLEYTPGVVMKLPESVEGWTGNELRFCHNPELCAKDYKDASFYMSQLELPDICPNCGQKLYKMARAEKEQLPDDTEFIKSAYTNDAGSRVFMSIVLSGTARDSIHRPQRCLKGQGNDLEAEYNVEVPIEGREPLSVRVIDTAKVFNTPEGRLDHYTYYAYWFVGQDKETPYHLERMFWLGWDRVVKSKANRWAYIAISGKRDPEEPEKHKEEIIDFVHKVYPYVLTEEMKKAVYHNR